MRCAVTEVLIVDLAHRDQANATCARAGLGQQVFAAGLSPTGEEPVTHFWCQRGDVDPVRRALDPAEIPYERASADDPEHAFEAFGLKIMPLGPGA